MQYPIAGANHTAEYQVSGHPFALASSSVGAIEFPMVTQWFSIKGNSGTVTFGFTEAGLNTTNKITAPSGSFSPMFPVKVKKLWISGSGGYELIAGLTNVHPEKLWNLVHPPTSGSINTDPNGANVDSTNFGYFGV